MKKNLPLISIIIPTYNRGQYIHKAINSCLNQTYKNIEILVIDDCSTDNTMDIIFSMKSDKINYYRNDKNKGPSFSRNLGIKLSKGSFINFLDDDDELMPEKLELQILKFDTSNIKNLGVITCDVKYNRIDYNEVRLNRKKGNIYIDLLKSYCIYGILSGLIKKECLLQTNLFDEDLIFNEEYDLHIQLSKNTNYDYIEDVLAIVNSSTNQITSNFKERYIGTHKIYNKYKSEYFKNNIFIYNFFRFNYLFLKYSIGKIIGKKNLLILP